LPAHNPVVNLFALGFRPFYLLAGLYAALALPVHALQYAGVLPGVDPLWHAREMLFGYAFAVIAGFLFTAVRNWTARETPSGTTLAAIAGLWLAARLIAPFALPVAAALDALFALAVAWGIGRPLVASGNRRNLFLVGIVLALGATGVAFLAWPGQALRLGLDLVLVVMAVIAGRVVPMFTNNAVPGARAMQNGRLEAAALASLVLLLFLDAAGVERTAAALAFLAAGLHGARLALWKPWKTWRKPILWILHVAYAWIVVHLALRGLAAFGLAPASLATHALTAGAIGGLTLGMMTRTARGHTGRTLEAGPMEVAAYVLVVAAAVVRVLVPLALPGAYLGSIVVSGLLWSGAFALFVVAYAPVLAGPRLDGKPG
jgi:uncharacterized protein involved in response to NO